MALDYKVDIEIDETALDVEWLEQASLALRYCRYWVFCKKKLTEADEKVKVVRAELIKRANSNPEKYCGKDKPNAADIEAYYRDHPLHKAAKEEWIEAQYNLDMAEVAKNEISFTRKLALENLVKLHGQQYFAGPKVPRNITEERKDRQKENEKYQKELNAKISSKMKPRRTK